MTHPTPSKGWTLFHYLSVYIGWGTSYFAIRLAVQHFSPAATLGLRFISAAVIMAIIGAVVLKGKQALPSRKALLSSALLGLAMLGLGTGLVGYAERAVPSGVTAILVGCAPLSFAIFSRLILGTFMSGSQMLGCAIGLTGVWILAHANAAGLSGDYTLYDVSFLLVAFISWSFASVWAKRMTLPKYTWVNATIQHATAGTVLLLYGFLSQEFTLGDIIHMPPIVFYSIFYLILIPSCITYTSYTWLIKYEPPQRVSTYAFVNPAVAVLLGTFIGHEPIDAWICLALLLTTVGTIITLFGKSLPEYYREKFKTPIKEPQA